MSSRAAGVRRVSAAPARPAPSAERETERETERDAEREAGEEAEQEAGAKAYEKRVAEHAVSAR